MLLTISCTRSPATDLGWLLHKHPDKVQEFTLAGGVARVVYPEATAERCTVALQVLVDPEAARLRRARSAGPGPTSGQVPGS